MNDPYFQRVFFIVLVKAVRDYVSGHLFHGQAGQKSAAAVYAALKAKVLRLLGNCDNVFHRLYAHVQTLAFRNAKGVRHYHKVLYAF